MSLLLPLLGLAIQLGSSLIQGSQQQAATDQENAREDEYNAASGQHINHFLNEYVLQPIGSPTGPTLGDPASMGPVTGMNGEDPNAMMSRQAPAGSGAMASMPADLLAQMFQQALQAQPPKQPKPSQGAGGQGGTGQTIVGPGQQDPTLGLLSMMSSMGGGVPGGAMGAGSPGMAAYGTPGAPVDPLQQLLAMMANSGMTGQR